MSHLFKFPFSLLIVISMAGCSEKRTTDPAKCYKLWAGSLPGSEVKPINGNYWQSANWSKEYIVYLELQATAEWKKQFISQNHLSLSKPKSMPQDAPAWFHPIKGYRIWESPDNTDDDYFEDMLTGHFFIYEEQL